MLGTGEATATRCYNTCFVVEAGGARLLVDAGGGNGILTQLEKARVGINDIHDMFVTHAHTDHVLGAVWVVRMIAHRIIDGLYDGILMSTVMTRCWACSTGYAVTPCPALILRVWAIRYSFMSYVMATDFA